MLNKKTNSETFLIETTCRSCLTRTFTDPDLHARLQEEENSIKKNNFQQSQLKSFSSVFSNRSVSSDEEVFLDLEQQLLQKIQSLAFMPRTPFPTPNSSYASTPKSYISSSSLASNRDSNEDIYSAAYRRYTF